ncbi:MAG TPA: UDP-N-acetylglucosamine 2-epimerase (non-hydrolyzing) [Magnetospirillum sp.]|nr:UDP-N-acetylglucosamine 2-epimerase (non-hydrolyzing) [Magnetospirillum sp.]
MRILIVIGTRPEAIKLAPLVHVLRQRPDIAVQVCLTSQHRELLAQGLADFGVDADYDLDIMTSNQNVNDVAARVLAGLPPILERADPDWVVVQGDTTTAMATSLAAFHHNRRVAHVEAGLRTGDLSRPWPEEMNRRLITQLAQLHFAPTERARANLLAEGVNASHIALCGNTVIDALLLACARLDDNPAAAGAAGELIATLAPDRPVVLTTMHRRENLSDEKLADVGGALIRIAADLGCQVVYPFHLNPRIQSMAMRLAAAHPDIKVIPPLPYFPFVALLRRASVILTDSGGIQEEASALGKPVLVMRERTERQEVIEAGGGKLVGTSADTIVPALAAVLKEGRAAAAPSDLFGDGRASQHICEHLLAQAGR